MIALAQMSAESPERLVASSEVSVVARVTALGPMLYRREASGIFHWLSQVYEARTERYLKGRGPETIRVGQTEGYLPRALAPTKVRIRAAQKRFGSYFAPMSTGSRYLFFLYPPYKEPELENVDLYGPTVFHPQRFRLSPDGTVAMEGVDDPYLDGIFPERSEKALIERIERVVAAEKQPSR